MSINETEIMDDKSNLLQNKSASTPALNAKLNQRAKTAPNSQINQLKAVCIIFLDNLSFLTFLLYSI